MPFIDKMKKSDHENIQHFDFFKLCLFVETCRIIESMFWFITWSMCWIWKECVIIFSQVEWISSSTSSNSLSLFKYMSHSTIYTPLFYHCPFSFISSRILRFFVYIFFVIFCFVLTLFVTFVNGFVNLVCTGWSEAKNWSRFVRY